MSFDHCHHRNSKTPTISEEKKYFSHFDSFYQREKISSMIIHFVYVFYMLLFFKHRHSKFYRHVLHVQHCIAQLLLNPGFSL